MKAWGVVAGVYIWSVWHLLELWNWVSVFWLNYLSCFLLCNVKHCLNMSFLLPCISGSCTNEEPCPLFYFTICCDEGAVKESNLTVCQYSLHQIQVFLFPLRFQFELFSRFSSLFVWICWNVLHVTNIMTYIFSLKYFLFT